MRERRILFVLAAVQFVNILDFMMVMPLGPDFAGTLGIPLSDLGLLGGSYTAAAAVAGVVGALALDRFDRRSAVLVALGGLVAGTLACALATGPGTMLLARVLSGIFGGPAAALSLAIVTDVVPAGRRGRAMGLMMASFAAAAVCGVPAGLELSRLGGWRLPFVAVAGAGALVALGVRVWLPPLRGHMVARPEHTGSVATLLGRPAVVLALAASAAVTAANFILLPNLAAYFQFNFGYPRQQLGLLYLVGGSLSLLAIPVAGRVCDRFSATSLASVGTALFAAALVPSFIIPVYSAPVLLLFCTVMGLSSFRMLPMQALATRVPEPDERARFMSAQSAVQQAAAAVGSMLGVTILSEGPGGALEGMAGAAWLAIVFSALLPPLIWRVEAQVRDRERIARSATADDAGVNQPPMSWRLSGLVAGGHDQRASGPGSPAP